MCRNGFANRIVPLAHETRLPRAGKGARRRDREGEKPSVRATDCSHQTTGFSLRFRPMFLFSINLVLQAPAIFESCIKLISSF